MIQYSCRLAGTEGPCRPSGHDELAMRFEFELTPIEFAGQPDEHAHHEEKNIQVVISGQVIRRWKLRATDSELKSIMYWYAVDALHKLKDLKRLDSRTAPSAPPDPARIAYPPNGPFKIDLPGPKMGFHASS